MDHVDRPLVDLRLTTGRLVLRPRHVATALDPCLPFFGLD